MLVAGFLIGFGLGLMAGRASAESLDQHERHGPPFTTVEELIRFHAASRGLRPGPLLALAECESSMDPMAVGDHGTSHGLYQLSTLPTGLMAHFRYVGFNSAYDTEQVIRYVVRVAAGDYLPSGPEPAPLHPFGRVSLMRWSCSP